MKKRKRLVFATADAEASAFDRVAAATRQTLADAWLLGTALLRAPRQIGAITPSGTTLANAMATELPGGEGIVIELGGGTGSITAALLRAGTALEHLVVIEQDPQLCARLQRRFPRCTVVCGDASKLPMLLVDIGRSDQRVKAVVSSLPLLSMTPLEQEQLLDAVWSVTNGRGPLIQFTYGLSCPVPDQLLAAFGANAQRREWVWCNLPPASVWRLENLAPPVIFPGDCALDQLPPPHPRELALNVAQRPRRQA